MTENKEGANESSVSELHAPVHVCELHAVVVKQQQLPDPTPCQHLGRNAAHPTHPDDSYTHFAYSLSCSRIVRVRVEEVYLRRAQLHSRPSAIHGPVHRGGRSISPETCDSNGGIVKESVNSEGGEVGRE